MQIKGSIKINSIFVRLIITFICILVPIYTLCIHIYSWSLRTLESEITADANKKVSFYLNDFETEIQRMKLLQYDFMEDDNLSSLAVNYKRMDDYTKYCTILALIQRLKTIKSSSKYITDVKVHIPSIGKTLSAENGYCNIMNDEVKKIMRADPPATESQMIYDKDTILMPATFPIYTRNTVPMFIVVIEISEANFTDTVNQLVTYEEGGSILLFHPGNQIISSNTNAGAETIKKMVSADAPYSVQPDRLKIGSRAFSIISTTSKYLGWSLLEYVPDSIIFKPIEKYHFYLEILIASSVVIIFVYSFMTYKSVHQPLHKLVKAFHKVEDGELDVRLNQHYHSEFGYIYASFNSMVENISTLIEQVYKQKILKQRAELKHLQLQINPHFLYNSFFILRSMIHNEEYDRSEKFVGQIGEYFRFVTRSAPDFIALSSEVEHARIYTDIQMTRFSNRIQTTFEELPHRYSGLQVPRLILQPIIENAFEHGLKNKVSGGILKIGFGDCGDGLSIFVEDNGDELSDGMLEKIKGSLGGSGNNDMETTGMINIHRRIRMKFGGDSGLHVSRSELGGLRVDVTLAGIPGEAEEHIKKLQQSI